MHTKQKMQLFQLKKHCLVIDGTWELNEVEENQRTL